MSCRLFPTSKQSCLSQCKRTGPIQTCSRELSEWPCTSANGVRGPEFNIGGGAVSNCVRGIVYEWTRGIVYERVRGVMYECVQGIVYECVRGVVYDWTRGAVYKCQRGGCDHVRMIYDVGALSPKIVTRCCARQSVLLSCLHVVCVVETPRVLKQGAYKLHCWFTEPDANLLLTCELFLLPSRQLVDLTRLYLGCVRSLWWFSWFVFEKSCCVVKLHRRRQFLGGSVTFFWYV